MKIIYEPQKSSAEEISVSYRQRAIVFKRGQAVDCNDELGAMLLTEANKFKKSE